MDFAYRRIGENIQNDSIKVKAIELSKSFGIEEFKASNGWINRFKKREGLKTAALYDDAGECYVMTC